MPPYVIYLLIFTKKFILHLRRNLEISGMWDMMATSTNAAQIIVLLGFVTPVQ